MNAFLAVAMDTFNMLPIQMPSKPIKPQIMIDTELWHIKNRFTLFRSQQHVLMRLGASFLLSCNRFGGLDFALKWIGAP